MRLAFSSIHDDPRYWEWMDVRANVVKADDTQGFVAVDEHGDIQGGVVFDSWTFTSVCAHIAIENPFVLRHGFLENAFGYAFEFADKELMIGITPSDIPEALKFNKHIGLRETYRIKDGHDYGVDLVVQEMRRDECRWIGEKHGQQKEVA